MALARHGFPRATDDFDLATDVDPFTELKPIVEALEAEGLRAELSLPDRNDPLGGVITIRGPNFKPIQVVNFRNPWNGEAPVGREAVHQAIPIEGTSFRVVDLHHLIALKLYAKSRKSEIDVLELLERNRSIDVAALRAVCDRFGLRARLEPLLAEVGLA